MSNKDTRMKWWREARYGMFIHWGLYAIPAGKWNSKDIPFGGEWIMKNAKIPVAEYEKLAGQFNPVKFDSEEWVKMAKDAGMKYMVVTAKHHDGFAMYDSKCSDYNIKDATPFKRDPMKELAETCRKEGITFCFYYSQLQDWHHPDAAGNDWDFTDASKKDFGRYIEEKVKPQLHELLTGYGPIGIIWFDTPYEMPKKYCSELVDFIRGIQPKCIISGRVGYGLGDYRQMGDNSIPIAVYNNDWETPMTLNDTWGYIKDDNNWKNPETAIRMLVDINGKGGNFLLNVGPDAEGMIPQGSADILKTIGDWLKLNGDSIYETIPTPNYLYELNWGGFTAKPGKLYMHVFNWPRFPYEIVVYGFKTKIKKAYFLADKEMKPVQVIQSYETARDEYRLRVRLPEEPIDTLDTVVVLELDGEPEVYNA
ncbi:MAG TPA: alpha-L-fucosidase [Ruminiclostridium sp.]